MVGFAVVSNKDETGLTAALAGTFGARIFCVGKASPTLLVFLAFIMLT